MPGPPRARRRLASTRARLPKPSRRFLRRFIFRQGAGQALMCAVTPIAADIELEEVTACRYYYRSLRPRASCRHLCWLTAEESGPTWRAARAMLMLDAGMMRRAVAPARTSHASSIVAGGHAMSAASSTLSTKFHTAASARRRVKIVDIMLRSFSLQKCPAALFLLYISCLYFTTVQRRGASARHFHAARNAQPLLSASHFSLVGAISISLRTAVM